MTLRWASEVVSSVLPGCTVGNGGARVVWLPAAVALPEEAVETNRVVVAQSKNPKKTI